MYKVSIIIPVYNVEPYLRECLDSAVHQTLKEIEILCIDDGSTDGSLAILREYEKNYANVKVFHKENGGLSSARNAGLDRACGQYISFLDSDDWFEPNACELAYQRAVETGAEIVRFFSRYVFSPPSDQRRKKRFSFKPLKPFKKLYRHLKTKTFSLEHRKHGLFRGYGTSQKEGTIPNSMAEMREIETTDPVEKLNFCHHPGGPNVWSKLWSSEFLCRHQLRFFEGILWEDVDFTTRAAVLARKVAILPQILHAYRQRSESIIGRNHGSIKHATDLMRSLNHAIDECRHLTRDAKVIDWIYNTKLTMIANDFQHVADSKPRALIARSLSSDEWSRLFDPLFETPTAVRHFFLTLYDAYFRNTPSGKTFTSFFSIFDTFPQNSPPTSDCKSPTLARGKERIRQSSHITFDIFDTLLIRPFVKPSDLFFYMESQEKLPQFAIKRIQAEQKARSISPHDEITLAEIYQEMPPAFSQLADLEIAYERKILRPNPEGLALYRYALALKKPVSLLSDMYLSAQTLQTILDKNSLDGYQKIYVSSESRQTKQNGGLFRLFLEENALAPHDVLHIGDNPHSDGRQPDLLGIGTFLLPRPVEEYFQHWPLERQYYEKNLFHLETSIALALSAYRQHKNAFSPFPSSSAPSSSSEFPETSNVQARNRRGQFNKTATPSPFSDFTLPIDFSVFPHENYWYHLGYRLGGAAIKTYLQFVFQTLQDKGIRNVFFVARDGWILDKAFRILAPSCLKPLQSRASLVTPEHRSEAVLHERSSVVPQTASDFCDDFPIKSHYLYASRQIGLGLFSQGEAVDPSSLSSALIEKRQTLQRYFERFLDREPESIALVDTVSSGEFSAQKLVASFLPEKDLYGIYWAVFPTDKRKKFHGKYESLFPFEQEQDPSSVLTKCWDLMEFLITSPEPPIRSLTPEGQPVYQEVNEDERWRLRLYQDISTGETDFLQDLVFFFGNDLPTFSTQYAIVSINHYLDHPSALDKRRMALVRHAADDEHRHYHPLLYYDAPLCDYWRLGKEYLDNVFSAYWHTKSQTLLLALLKPVSIRIRKKGSTFSLFPRLNRNIFRLEWSLTPKYKITFQIGKKGPFF